MPRIDSRLGIAIVALASLLVGVVVIGPWLIQSGTTSSLNLGPDQDTGLTRLLVDVKAGRAVHLLPAAPSLQVRLTTIDMQMAQSPESGELDLNGLEGRVLVVEGRDAGGWVYSARIARALSPLRSRIVRYAFK